MDSGLLLLTFTEPQLALFSAPKAPIADPVAAVIRTQKIEASSHTCIALEAAGGTDCMARFTKRLKREYQMYNVPQKVKMFNVKKVNKKP